MSSSGLICTSVMDTNLSFSPRSETDGLFDFHHLVGKHNMWPPIILFLFVMTTVLGVIGNSVVMYLTAVKLKLGTSVGDVYIFQRALAEILFLCVVPFGMMSFTHHGFFFGYEMCVFVSASMQVGVVVSVAFLFLLAEDCYLVYCCKSHEHRTRVQKIGSYVVWLAAVLLAVLFGFLAKYTTTSQCRHCLSIPLFDGDSSVWGVILMFLVLFPTLSLWVYILLTTPRESRKSDVEHLVVNTEQESSYRPLMMALTRTITICQCPYWLYRIVATITSITVIPPLYFTVFGLFGLPFILNPILFVWYRA